MLKKLILLVLILLAVAGAGLLYVWRQAAQLPDWYQPETAAAVSGREPAPVEPAPPAGSAGSGPAGSGQTTAGAPRDRSPAAATRDLRREVRREAARGGTLRLDEQELNTLLSQALDSKPDGRRVREATRAVRASLEDGRLAVGAVTDLERLSAAARDDKERAAIAKLRRLAPWIEGREFYLGAEGRPRADGGELAFDGVTVQIGRLSFEPARLLALVGLADDRLDRQLAVRLPEAELTDVRIDGDSLLLSLADD